MTPLHEYSSQPAPPAKKYNLPFPVWNEADYASVKFINVLNALLQYTSENSSEKELRARFAKIGIVPGTSFDESKFSPETVKAIQKGIAEAKQEIESGAQQVKDARDLFGTREMLKNNYLNRAIGTATGLYGNTKEEAIYIGTTFDKDNQPLSGNKNKIHKGPAS